MEHANQNLNQNFFRVPIYFYQLLSSIITSRIVKPFIKAVDLYPGFKLEEECFSKAIIKDVDQNKSRFKKKSELDQDGPMSWPREKSAKETSYERFVEESLIPRQESSILKEIMMAGQ
jgi:hypothetical protein